MYTLNKPDIWSFCCSTKLASHQSKTRGSSPYTYSAMGMFPPSDQLLCDSHLYSWVTVGTHQWAKYLKVNLGHAWLLQCTLYNTIIIHTLAVNFLFSAQGAN